MSTATRPPRFPEPVKITPTLHERLASIASVVGKIKATGKTPQGAKALSIVNVEDALRPLFIEHRVVTGFRWNDKPTPLERVSRKVNEQTGEVFESKYYEWMADLTVWLANADDAGDRIEDRTCDIGSSPSAAVSFALKRYYRALFHLADEGDETRTVGGATSRGGVSTPSTSRRVAPKPAPAHSASPPAPEGEAPGVPGTPEGQRDVNHGPAPSVPQEEIPLTPMGRLQRAAEQFHRKPWSAVRALVMAQARSHFRKSLDDLTDEEIGELADEIEGLVLNRNPEQKT